jgi:hypothetical protein
MNFPAEHVDEAGVLEQQFGRLFAAGDGKFLTGFTHFKDAP